ncbi:hypothetical protein [Pseudorhodoplanes sp.]|jgi:hypothetical protein|uniref:hypothetical protein n=1 Tax=Pseudorhodoplanes sp. TaxID=1934341 RepID=UPI002CC6BAA7|nr:hypothetical protein [Pseudorhodoplanes sp.]HWV43302.1 hypothetical protein [Pseudorhodoplanes sp.]
MVTNILVAMWQNIGLIFSLSFIGLMLLGFLRGMRIKPRPYDERAPERWMH